MILVYQMLKVASRTWVEAARPASALESSEPLHVHFISRKNLDRIAAIGAMSGARQTIANGVLLRAMLRKGPEARAAIDEARRSSKTIRVLSGVRDPVARALSIVHFFADFYGDSSRPLDRSRGGDPATTAAAVLDWWRPVLDGEQPKDSFARLMVFMIGAYWTWFADEFEAELGISLGAGPFPSREGAQRISAQGIEALLYRVEDMAPDSPAHGALLSRAADFLGAPLSRLPEINMAATRRSYPRYQAARKLLRLPKPLLDEIYAAPILERFYSPGEISAFKTRWS